MRILGRKTVQLMTTNHIGELEVIWMGRGYGFGLGVAVRTDLSGVPTVGSVGSYGWPGVWGIWCQIDPSEDAGQPHGVAAVPHLLGRTVD